MGADEYQGVYIQSLIRFRKPPALLVSTHKALPFDYKHVAQASEFFVPTRLRVELVFRPLLGAFLIPPALPVVTELP